jgi:hypothetical protein
LCHVGSRPAQWQYAIMQPRPVASTTEQPSSPGMRLSLSLSLYDHPHRFHVGHDNCHRCTTQ